MKQNNKNKLLEFTATVQLEDDIYEKYKDRILYRYDLKEFMQQGYSKMLHFCMRVRKMKIKYYMLY